MASIRTTVIAAVLVCIPVGVATAGVLHGSSGSAVSLRAVARPSGKTSFMVMGCGGCHTMKAARAKGTVGPNLDRAKPSRALVIKTVTKGKGVMPAFLGPYTKAQIAAVATYVANKT